MKKAKAEEILAKHAGCEVETINDTETILLGQDVILPAMEEYAEKCVEDCLNNDEFYKTLEALAEKAATNFIKEAFEAGKNGADFDTWLTERTA